MENNTTSPAEKTYIVWADRRCFQHVQASSPEAAFAEAQKYPGDFEPCSDGIENFELHPVVADLDTDEEFAVGPVEADPVMASLMQALKGILRCPKMAGPVGTTAYIISDERMNAARAAIAQAEGR